MCVDFASPLWTNLLLTVENIRNYKIVHLDTDLLTGLKGLKKYNSETVEKLKGLPPDLNDYIFNALYLKH